jgi:hypothetical protein
MATARLKLFFFRASSITSFIRNTASKLPFTAIVPVPIAVDAAVRSCLCKGTPPSHVVLSNRTEGGMGQGAE